ncbi:MAG: hypothetical protein HY904_21745 [Deltaproteobacteria bacterium]|nr:hypothetical protein [Deltaproteobacteria bacterium]
MASEFVQAVDATPSVRDRTKPGLRALGPDSAHVRTGRRRITGSLDLDRATREARPNAARWDYGFGYVADGRKEVAVWVEVHPAGTSNAAEILQKVRWLKAWLLKDAPELDALTRRPHSHGPFHWLASGGVHLDPSARSVRAVLQEGVAWPRTVLNLDTEPARPARERRTR